MYRQEMNERSPMRVFQKSMHGGLGRGKLGVVAAGPGVGKTALLVQIALDELLRSRRVLHISHEHAVDHVRNYYSEIFHEISEVSRLREAAVVKLDCERHRLIFSLCPTSGEGPVSRRGGRSPVGRILEVVRFAREVAHFIPDVLIIDGFDLTGDPREALIALGELAREANAELWVSCQAAAPERPGELPRPLDGSPELLDVVVWLSPETDAVRLCLLKDHSSPEVVTLRLRLDPHTMRVLDEDLPPASERMRDARGFRLVSGGSEGAEEAFGACAERWGMEEVNYTFDGQRRLARQRGQIMLEEEELSRGDFSLVYVSRRLKRQLSEIPMVRRVLQTIWHQITDAGQVFAVGTIQEDGTVRGGTGWGAELARIWHKPLYVYDQERTSWFFWNGAAWEVITQPTITSAVFAGIGTQRLTEQGHGAIEELYSHSFGAPKTG